ncbi:hypothetical protein NDU88_003458 [Pleurodeles waltl]|uniref:Uncharacterized protein n=1 Tax=Pleurodeles waltl TaxID=8319 RepID=A0AAV7UG82_PLEWA|nr:hypothetical protein NDU88_003458 [Pleurodeles waltl]
MPCGPRSVPESSGPRCVGRGLGIEMAPLPRWAGVPWRHGPLRRRAPPLVSVSVGTAGVWAPSRLDALPVGAGGLPAPSLVAAGGTRRLHSCERELRNYGAAPQRHLSSRDLSSLCVQRSVDETCGAAQDWGPTAGLGIKGTQLQPNAWRHALVAGDLVTAPWHSGWLACIGGPLDPAPQGPITCPGQGTTMTEFLNRRRVNGEPFGDIYPAPP